MIRRFQVGAPSAGTRLDLFLVSACSDLSRSRIQKLIEEGAVQIAGRPAKRSHAVRAGEDVAVEVPEPRPTAIEAEAIPLSVLYEDEDFLAVDKPPGLVVHPSPGHPSGTLVNALLHHVRDLPGLGGELRPGIVHRLDRDTSGVLLVARTDAAHRNLAGQFAARTVEKTYVALVHGSVARETGAIDSKITRDPVRRTRMTTRLDEGRAAHTEYRVMRRLAKFTLLEVRIGTGRTHQIRVHLAGIGHPVAGDRLYGAAEAGMGRFFLHAHRICFHSPSTGALLTVEAPLAPELATWLAGL